MRDTKSRKKRMAPPHSPNVTTDDCSNRRKRSKQVNLASSSAKDNLHPNIQEPVGQTCTSNVDSEEEYTTNERVGQNNAVLYSRAKDDFKLSLAIGCHFNPLTLPNQYRLPFTKLDNITPEMIIAGFGLLEYAIGRQGGGKVVCLKPQNNNRFQCCMGCHFVNLLLWTVF